MTITTMAHYQIIREYKGAWLSESLDYGRGSLAFRTLSDGVGVPFRNGGKQVNLPIGR